MSMNLGGRWILAGLLAVTAGGAGLAGSALAEHGEGLQAMHGMHGAGKADPAAMEARFDKHLAEMVPDATAEQKTRLKAIAGAVHGDMEAIHAGLRDTHRQLHALLLAPTVDRAALEKLRAAQMTRVDAASRRVASAFADAAEVLTPDQRRRLADKLQAPKG